MKFRGESFEFLGTKPNGSLIFLLTLQNQFRTLSRNIVKVRKDVFERDQNGWDSFYKVMYFASSVQADTRLEINSNYYRIFGKVREDV